jgi:hypothetical protein
MIEAITEATRKELLELIWDYITEQIKNERLYLDADHDAKEEHEVWPKIKAILDRITVLDPPMYQGLDLANAVLEDSLKDRILGLEHRVYELEIAVGSINDHEDRLRYVEQQCR